MTRQLFRRGAPRREPPEQRPRHRRGRRRQHPVLVNRQYPIRRKSGEV